MFGKKQETLKPDFEYFVIFDSKVGTYRQPLLAINREDILRQMEKHFRETPDSELLHNAEDFSIFKVGSFSKTTGQLVGQNHEHIANVHDIRSSFLRKASERSQSIQSVPPGFNAVPLTVQNQ